MKDRPTLAQIKRSWPATVNASEAARAIGCSKSHLNALIKQGQAPVQTVPGLGSRNRVITASLIRLLEGPDAHDQKGDDDAA
ncbi:hypothetical protein F4561_002237 [Lipingzhangella halophila]|uniref:DNA-binding protein n=1 Tax=Lipingzhangella halophila TaxID=1783352 RepID=A0A7W7RGD9_9ACTN|nr:DNA-binding protein [Lipingzhangella halophila]MBB4931417.1 hypothetical protein [Lipingzhangella halophila]